MQPRNLTPKQRAFVLAYAACGNATEAARRAGYRKPNPEGARLLANASVLSSIKDLMKENHGQLIAAVEERQAFWTMVMRNEQADMRDRLKASELLGKAQGDFIIRHELSDPMKLVLYLPDNGRDPSQAA